MTWAVQRVHTGRAPIYLVFQQFLVPAFIPVPQCSTVSLEKIT